MSVAASIAAARSRNYRDPDENPDVLDWSDPVTRVAAGLDTFTYETPERVGAMMGAARERLEATWAGKHPTDRQLLRRRAAIALEIGEGLGAPA